MKSIVSQSKVKREKKINRKGWKEKEANNQKIDFPYFAYFYVIFFHFHSMDQFLHLA